MTAINRVFTHVGVNLNRYLNNPLQTSIHKCTDICAYILSGLNIYTHNLSRIYVQPRKTALATTKDRTRNPERPHSQPRKTALTGLKDRTHNFFSLNYYCYIYGERLYPVLLGMVVLLAPKTCMVVGWSASAHSRVCECALSGLRVRTLGPVTAHSRACECALAETALYLCGI